MGGLLLYEFEQHSVCGSGVDECNLSTAVPRAWPLVHDPKPAGAGLRHRRLDIPHRERDVVDALPAIPEELRDGARFVGWLEQFNPRPADIEERDAHPLARDDFGTRRFRPEEREPSSGVIGVPDRDADVMDSINHTTSLAR